MKVESDGLCWHSFGMFSLRYPESIWICFKIRGTKDVLASASSCNIYPLYQLQRYMMRCFISPCTFSMKMMLNTLHLITNYISLSYHTSPYFHPHFPHIVNDPPWNSHSTKKNGWLEVWNFPFWETLFCRVQTVRFKDCIFGVSENGGFSPQIIHFHRDFHYKSSILGETPLFWETPIYLTISHESTSPKKSHKTFTPQIHHKGIDLEEIEKNPRRLNWRLGMCLGEGKLRCLVGMLLLWCFWCGFNLTEVGGKKGQGGVYSCQLLLKIVWISFGWHHYHHFWFCPLLMEFVLSVWEGKLV